jgi:hypothetical protein
MRRLVEYGHGFHPFGQPDLTSVRDAMRTAGRDFDELEVVGGIRPRFPDPDSPADLAEAAEQIPAQAEARLHGDLLQPRAIHGRPAASRQALPRARRVRRLGDHTPPTRQLDRTLVIETADTPMEIAQNGPRSAGAPVTTTLRPRGRRSRCRRG